jgi:hypothetical protein
MARLLIRVRGCEKKPCDGKRGDESAKDGGSFKGCVYRCIAASCAAGV